MSLMIRTDAWKSRISIAAYRCVLSFKLNFPIIFPIKLRLFLSYVLSDHDVIRTCVSVQHIVEPVYVLHYDRHVAKELPLRSTLKWKSEDGVSLFPRPLHRGGQPPPPIWNEEHSEFSINGTFNYHSRFKKHIRQILRNIRRRWDWERLAMGSGRVSSKSSRSIPEGRRRRRRRLPNFHSKAVTRHNRPTSSRNSEADHESTRPWTIIANTFVYRS